LKIEISKIKVRKRIRENMGDIEGFAANIKVFGILQPIWVIKIKDDQYQLVAGYRRLQAAKMLSHKTIQADIKSG